MQYYMLCRYLIKPTHQILMIMLRMKLSGLMERSNQTCKRDRLFCPFIFQELPLMCVYSTLFCIFWFCRNFENGSTSVILIKSIHTGKKNRTCVPKGYMKSNLKRTWEAMCYYWAEVTSHPRSKVISRMTFYCTGFWDIIFFWLSELYTHHLWSGFWAV